MFRNVTNTLDVVFPYSLTVLAMLAYHSLGGGLYSAVAISLLVVIVTTAIAFAFQQVISQNLLVVVITFQRCAIFCLSIYGAMFAVVFISLGAPF